MLEEEPGFSLEIIQGKIINLFIIDSLILTTISHHPHPLVLFEAQGYTPENNMLLPF